MLTASGTLPLSSAELLKFLKLLEAVLRIAWGSCCTTKFVAVAALGMNNRLEEDRRCKGRWKVGDAFALFVRSADGVGIALGILKIVLVTAEESGEGSEGW